MELGKLSSLLLARACIIMLLTCLLFIRVVKPLCRGDERPFLLEIKSSFVVDRSASSEALAYPKTGTWNRGTGDCCSWDGVECDRKNGHVISLDLSSSCLYGSITSNSSIFKLSHLQRLNLTDNHFNHSVIPPELGRLSSLRLIDLSSAFFVGKIPTELSLLSNLSTLDLSFTDIGSRVPSFLANFSFLTHLVMKNCGVYGEFPSEIFQLPKLEFLAIQQNQNLSGYLAEFRANSPMKKLYVSRTSFSGSIPSSIGELSSLESLSVARAKFSGVLPASFGKLANLRLLDVSGNNFSGPIPSFFGNLTGLSTLWFGGNQIVGRIPAWFGNLTNLTVLSLAKNNLYGPVPRSVSRLVNLRTLNLFENNLNGTLDFDYMFRNMTSLAELRLDENKLSVITKGDSVNGTFGKFEVLGLSSCNLVDFPAFLVHQDKLRYLDLGRNNIHGRIPNWILEKSKETMAYLALNDNFLKTLTDISYLLCSLNSLQLLDLSNNLLSGIELPKCLENPDNLLSVLNIRNNSFQGTIPQMCSNNGSLLKMIDLSYNRFVGPIPKSLRNCLMLESLNVGNNQLDDVFPFWLGTLAKLKLLILRSNRLHGAIRNPNSGSTFSNLRVIDVSRNYFTGKLPSKYFRSWSAMKVFDSSNSYLKTESSFEAVKRTWFLEYTYSTTITIKGTEVRYGKIQEVLVVVDFSSNEFDGEIPESVGDLQGLRVLNLSNNILSGEIPTSLGDIMRVESLDLSHNRLSGEIPQRFLELTFLSFFNVSHNRLIGRIPRGNQLNTFDNSSYVGNLGLCGYPLSKTCEDLNESTNSSSVPGDESNSPFEDFSWIVVVLGFGSGIVVGIIIENTVLTKERELWFGKTCRDKKQVRRRRRQSFYTNFFSLRIVSSL